eukprot:TRINITY_DN12405_c0_g1_i3.p1 TRINITY_DN12405_c0_g1~~TRINITY_DN12405_c0_g1_i3.p1  ORF type:complete len:194 (-),score=41.90 TRINITY_DN12405_c0_g1_i3:209-790(-)
MCIRDRYQRRVRGAYLKSMSLVQLSRRSAALTRPLNNLLIVRAQSTSAAADKDLFPGAYSHRDSPGIKYTEQKRNQNRPVSPHIFIYAWPPASLSSIANRFSGIAMSVGMLGMGSVGLVGGDVSAMMAAIGASSVGGLAKFSVAFPFSYHYVVGIRHLVWDRKPEMLTNEEVTKTSYGVFGVAGAISLIAAVV